LFHARSFYAFSLKRRCEHLQLIMYAPWPPTGTQLAAQNNNGKLLAHYKRTRHHALAIYCKLHVKVQTTWLVGWLVGLPAFM